MTEWRYVSLLKATFENRQMKKIASFQLDENTLFEEQLIAGDLELAFAHQEALAEQMPAGGVDGAFLVRGRDRV